MNLSDRKHGIHFYINISNFDQVVLAEEESIGRVNHSIHALDTYFTSIMRYGKSHFGEYFTVEKITGARLHMYVISDVVPAYRVVECVASYAFLLSKTVNRDISKYNRLKDFKIQVGACYGHFYEFVFKHQNENEEQDYEELTTIGYAANLAAKLQGLANASSICISEEIFNEISDSEKNYSRCYDDSLRKYDQKYYYEARLDGIAKLCGVTVDVDGVKEYANKVNLTDMDFTDVKKPLAFKDLSKTNGKKIRGVPLFADVRDFTSKFKDDDSNLGPMAVETERILTSMYDVTTKYGGIHVQFQGDREEILFHDIGSETSIEKAVFAGMRLIDVIQGHDISIGVGADYGVLYATKIGARGEKDNILVGKTVISADRLEDALADPNQIVISETIYNSLVKLDSSLVHFFKKIPGGYVATIGYKEYLATVTSNRHRSSTDRGAYNKAWGE